MTDKENNFEKDINVPHKHKPIYLDGVDISECLFYQSNFEEDFDVKIRHFCSNWHNSCESANNSNCYYKQLARKTQECEELKRQKAVLKSWSKYLEQWKDSLLKDNDYYRNTLENIEKIIKEYDCVNCSEQHCEDCNKGEIFYIINKVKGE